MKVNGVPFRSVWLDETDSWSVRIIDQTRLPWSLDIVRLTDLRQAAHAIRSMQVRGAPLIGAVAAYGLALSLRADPSTANLERCRRAAGRRRVRPPSTCAGRSIAC